MNTLRLRTALGLAFIATISGTMPLTATATQPYPPSTKPSVQVGPTANYRYPTDTPGAGLIDKDGSFHVQQSAALYGANDVREWAFLTGNTFDDLIPDKDLNTATNPANPQDRNDDTRGAAITR